VDVEIGDARPRTALRGVDDDGVAVRLHLNGGGKAAGAAADDRRARAEPQLPVAHEANHHRAEHQGDAPRAGGADRSARALLRNADPDRFGNDDFAGLLAQVEHAAGLVERGERRFQVEPALRFRVGDVADREHHHH
jgi:hypothetical protein